ncbi:putative pentatricopeptide [Medicago truncatula]|uniref:Putative pentatricopeptide n=1 Tax=Medicago truncatula TaxID=3880 RepID=A0A396HP59_MEDTR|nr:putative pentatricopeptide [Medicago truncatula]
MVMSYKVQFLSSNWIIIAKGFKLDHVSYRTLINELCKTGETRAALQVLRKIERILVKPNVLMYTTIIDSLCKDKLVIDAYDLYSEMIKKISPDVVTYNTLVHGFCIAGQLKEAIGFIDHTLLKT